MKKKGEYTPEEIVLLSREELKEIIKNKKHLRFSHEYIIDWNGKRAYKVAYPDVKDSTAYNNSCRLLKDAYIKAYINIIKNDIEVECGISKMMIVKEHMNIAFSSISKFHKSWIELKDYDKLTEEEKSLIKVTHRKPFRINEGTIKKPKYKTVERIRIELHSKENSLKELANLLGYNNPTQIDHTTKGDKIQTFDPSLLSTDELIKRSKAVKEIDEQS